LASASVTISPRLNMAANTAIHLFFIFPPG
jgi:hypothetical protein